MDQQLSKFLINEQKSCDVANNSFKEMTYGTHRATDKQNILSFEHSRRQYIIISER
jgi:hypothetical protein